MLAYHALDFQGLRHIENHHEEALCARFWHPASMEARYQEILGEKAGNKLERGVTMSWKDTCSQLSRRWFLRGTAGGIATVALISQGCKDYFPSEEGEAFLPWTFPGNEADPYLLSVWAATLAASPHNTQGWLFRIDSDVIEVYQDLDRSLEAMDPIGREMTIGVGCALENLAIAAQANGLQPELTYLPSPGDPAFIARLDTTVGSPERVQLYDEIPRRRCNRARYGDFALPREAHAEMLELTENEPSVELILITGGDRWSIFQQETIEATRVIIDDQEMLEANDPWRRESEESLEQQRDGLTVDATTREGFYRVMGKAGGRLDLDKWASYWLDATEVQVEAASAFALLATPSLDDLEELVRCGRLFQRLSLWATRNGIAVHPLNQVPELRDREVQLGGGTRFGDVLNELAETSELHVQMCVRLGYAWETTLMSPRRPVEWVLL